MRVLGLKNCDRTRAAMEALKEQGHDPVLVDIRAEPLAAEERAAILAAFGDRAINRASTTWRGLSDDEKPGQWPGFWRITRRS